MLLRFHARPSVEGRWLQHDLRAREYRGIRTHGTSARPSGLSDWSIGCFVHDF